MGVLSCIREGCSNIMCDIYVPSIGYICNVCAKEFVERYSHNEYKNDSEITEALKTFLEEEKLHGNLSSPTDLHTWIDQYRK